MWLFLAIPLVILVAAAGHKPVPAAHKHAKKKHTTLKTKAPMPEKIASATLPAPVAKPPSKTEQQKHYEESTLNMVMGGASLSVAQRDRAKQCAINCLKAGYSKQQAIAYGIKRARAEIRS